MEKYSFILILILCSFCKDTDGEIDLIRFEYQHPSMGSLFKVVAYSADSLELANVVNRAFIDLDSLNLIMSDYIPHSELMKLSRRSGRNEYVPVSKELFHILQLSQYWYEWSDGIFDITIGSYSQLWRRAKRQGIPPDEKMIASARESVGFDHVEIDLEKGILLKKDKMQLDLGGIAKGYAVDYIFDILVENGYPICLVDGGGDLRAGQKPPDGEGWKVKVQTQVAEDSTMLLNNRAIATSGDFYRSLEIDGKRYSHIINPFTGYGITDARAVTVIAEDCTTADVLASVFSIAGPDDHGLNEKLPENAEVFIYEMEEDDISLYLIEGKKTTR